MTLGSLLIYSLIGSWNSIMYMVMNIIAIILLYIMVNFIQLLYIRGLNIRYKNVKYLLVVIVPVLLCIITVFMVGAVEKNEYYDKRYSYYEEYDVDYSHVHNCILN